MIKVSLGNNPKLNKTTELQVSANNCVIVYAESVIDSDGNIVFPGLKQQFQLAATPQDTDEVKTAKKTLTEAIETGFVTCYKTLSGLS